jgi:hypothetical protein
MKTLLIVPFVLLSLGGCSNKSDQWVDVTGGDPRISGRSVRLDSTSIVRNGNIVRYKTWVHFLDPRRDDQNNEKLFFDEFNTYEDNCDLHTGILIEYTWRYDDGSEKRYAGNNEESDVGEDRAHQAACTS